jgi:hypothetical protein
VGKNKIELAWPNWKTKHTLQKQRALNHKKKLKLKLLFIFNQLNSL